MILSSLAAAAFIWTGYSSWSFNQHTQIVSYKNNQISNDPKKLIKNNSKISFDQTSVLEFAMSSYVLNNRTLLKSIFQVRPGEIIELPVFKKKQYSQDTAKN